MLGSSLRHSARQWRRLAILLFENSNISVTAMNPEPYPSPDLNAEKTARSVASRQIICSRELSLSRKRASKSFTWLLTTQAPSTYTTHLQINHKQSYKPPNKLQNPEPRSCTYWNKDKSNASSHAIYKTPLWRWPLVWQLRGCSLDTNNLEREASRRKKPFMKYTNRSWLPSINQTKLSTTNPLTSHEWATY